jgi:hypothetical protein
MNIRARIHIGSDGEDDMGSVGFKRIRLRLIQFHNHPRGWRTDSMQGVAHYAHAVEINWNMLLFVNGGIGKF